MNDINHKAKIVIYSISALYIIWFSYLFIKNGYKFEGHQALYHELDEMRTEGFIGVKRAKAGKKYSPKFDFSKIKK